MTNRAIELHDSTLDRVEATGDGILIVLSAYVHHSDGEPGVSAGTGWSAESHFFLARSQIDPQIQDLPVELSDGQLLCGASEFSNCIPVPFASKDEFRFLLKGVRGEITTVQGTGIDVRLVGPEVYVEDFPGSGVRASTSET